MGSDQRPQRHFLATETGFGCPVREKPLFHNRLENSHDHSSAGVSATRYFSGRPRDYAGIPRRVRGKQRARRLKLTVVRRIQKIVILLPIGTDLVPDGTVAQRAGGADTPCTAAARCLTGIQYTAIPWDETPISRVLSTFVLFFLIGEAAELNGTHPIETSAEALPGNHLQWGSR